MDPIRKTLLAIALIALVALALGLLPRLGSVGGGGDAPKWIVNDLAKGEQLARAEKKPILLYFGAGW